MSCKQTTLSFMLVKMQRGKRLRSQTKEVVANVYDYGKRKLTLVELRFLLQQRDIDFPDPC